MNRSIKFNLGSLEIYKSSKSFTDNNTFKIPFADSLYHEFVGGKAVFQCYSNFLYFMELIEFSSENQHTIYSEVLEPSLFMFFIFEGEAEFSSPEGNILSCPARGTYYATFCDQGIYKKTFKPGCNIILYISLRIEWIQRKASALPNLSKFLSFCLKSNVSVSYMEKLFMSRSLAKELIKIWHLPILDNIDLETTLLPMIKKILRIYDRAQDYRIHLSEMSNSEKIHEIKEYLKSGCLSTEITDIEALCKRYFIIERTLRRLFFKLEKKTIIDFVTDHRLEHSKLLLTKRILSVKEISEQCGFASPSYFCRLFKKKYAMTPKRYSLKGL
ncbi:helix-turn-helix transcriptional regulator [Sphingobacterium zeae]|uniref:AraC-like DNA-binding protein n=1 Tax=Sphingobacterium zeae TaxID=1776859 RepID=A0ABU0U677_9SPHI|nr:helix-turn-helix transcriptional regulator [Sphingobacterium zeae]MDQ1150467.1 AraC-like DNA-binding protein [Sphingobacterium zeae]